jgi:hypothetical protein
MAGGSASPHAASPGAPGGQGWQIVFTVWNLFVYATWMVLPFVLARSVAWLG